MSPGVDLFERPSRDLAADELWRRSLSRSRERRALASAGAPGRRSLISAAIPDLDAPAQYARLAASSDRDLSDEEIWDLSLACAHAKRQAAERGLLQQARLASAPLVVAAVAALAPTQGGAHPRGSAAQAAQRDAILLKMGSRGPAMRAVQRALGIPADGIFGPQTRAAVRAFQARHGLLVDGIVGPQTRSVLFGQRDGDDQFIRAWWVAPVQRALGVPVDGIYGGRPSDHSYYPSRAIDVAGSPAAMRGYALAVAGRPGIKYVIYSPLGTWGNWNGSWNAVTGGTRAAHFSHVHVSATR